MTPKRPSDRSRHTPNVNPRSLGIGIPAQFFFKQTCRSHHIPESQLRLTQDAPNKTLGFLITFVDKDTDLNESLSKADNKSLLAIRSDGSSPNLLMQNLKNTPTTIRSSPNSKDIFILLREGSNLTHSQFDRTTFTLGPQQSIQLP